MPRPMHSEQQEHTCAKERITAAAERLFAEQGYAATSVAQIAQAAQANRALLYYYFDDKRDLYVAIIEGRLDEMVRVLGAATRGAGGPWERLERFVRSYYGLLLARHHAARIVFRELMFGGEQIGSSIEGHARENLTRVREIIEEGLRGGELQGLDPELTAFSLLGMIHVFFMQHLATGRSFPADVVVEHTMSLLRHGAGAPIGVGEGGKDEDSGPIPSGSQAKGQR